MKKIDPFLYPLFIVLTIVSVFLQGYGQLAILGIVYLTQNLLIRKAPWTLEILGNLFTYAIVLVWVERWNTISWLIGFNFLAVSVVLLIELVRRRRIAIPLDVMNGNLALGESDGTFNKR